MSPKIALLKSTEFADYRNPDRIEYQVDELGWLRLRLCRTDNGLEL